MDKVQTDYSPEVKEHALLTLRQQLGFEGVDFEGKITSEIKDVICQRLGVNPTEAEFIYDTLWADGP